MNRIHQVHQDLNESRIPPQAVEVEKSVLGAMLLDREAVSKAIELLDEHCFYNPTHQKIYSSMISLFEKSDPVDAVTVTNELSRRGDLNKAEDPLYLTELTRCVTTTANVEYHARIVLEKALARMLIVSHSEVISRAYREDEDIIDLLDDAESKIFQLSEKRLRKSWSPMNVLLHKTFESLQSIHGGDGITGVPSGFHEIDEMTAGFQNSDLVIIAGRPSQGKTALALAIAKNAAMHPIKKTGVGIFSLEMSEQQLIIRMMSSAAKVNSHALRRGKMPEEHWKSISRIIGKLAEAQILIDDTAAIGILELRAKARRLKAEKNIGMIIVDYLQLVVGPKNSESREREISNISRSLKALAKELNIPVIALSQLNRASEARSDKRPQLSDLRESGAIEQDADTVIFVHRPETFGIKEYRDAEGLLSPSEGIAELIIAKQRNGPTGVKFLTFIKQYSGFEQMAPKSVMIPPPSDQESIF